MCSVIIAISQATKLFAVIFMELVDCRKYEKIKKTLQTFPILLQDLYIISFLKNNVHEDHTRIDLYTHLSVFFQDASVESLSTLTLASFLCKKIII